MITLVAKQTLFLLGLYLLGTSFALLFHRRISTAFIIASGFLWGACLWVFSAMLILVAFSAYSARSMALAMLIITLIVLSGHVWLGTWRLSRRQVKLLAIAVSGFAIWVFFMDLLRNVMGTYDSVAILTSSHALGESGLTSWTSGHVVDWGIFLMVIQSASAFIGRDYLSVLQPAFSLTLFLTLFYFVYTGALPYLHDRQKLLRHSRFVLLLFMTIPIILWQVFYIHTNAASGTYLLAAVGCYWLALREHKNIWLLFGTIAITAFSLLRVEAPLFALAFLALLLSATPLSFLQRLQVVVPYTVAIVSWELFILNLGDETGILQPSHIKLIILLLMSFLGFMVASGIPIVEKYLLHRLHSLMFAVLVAILIGTFVLNFNHMWTSITIVVNNLLNWQVWSITWVLLPCGLIYILLQDSYPDNERIFRYGITAFFLLVMIVVYERPPYRIGWADSANRMITHVTPVIFLYLSIGWSRLNAALAPLQHVEVTQQSEISN